MDYYCNIEHVIETLKNGKSRNKKCSLLIGAGCSVTADIPTAEGFVLFSATGQFKVAWILKSFSNSTCSSS